MNNDRRKQISDIEKRLSALKESASQIKVDIDDAKSEEEEAKENLPDSLQQGDKGEAMDANIGNLESASEQVDDIETSIEEAGRYLEAAREGE
jgi:predicted  nucleic acid-binding Zn-ribbon protein